MTKSKLRRMEFELDSKVKEFEEVIEKHNRGESVSEHALYMAQEELPYTKQHLRNIQKKIYGWRAMEKVYSEPQREHKKNCISSDQLYESPGHELLSRAQTYAAKHGISFETASVEILREDPFLAEKYLNQ